MVDVHHWQRCQSACMKTLVHPSEETGRPPFSLFSNNTEAGEFVVVGLEFSKDLRKTEQESILHH